MSSPDSFKLRRETTADLGAIREVETAAFGRPGEAALVEALRAAGALVHSGVAEVEDKVVAHIAFSPVTIENKVSGCEAIALAPLAVRPEWQRKGV